MAETSNYVVKTVVALFIFAALAGTTFTMLDAINASATVTAIVVAIEVIFGLGVLYKIAEGAGMV